MLPLLLALVFRLLCLSRILMVYREVQRDGVDQWILSLHGELGRRVKVMLGSCSIYEYIHDEWSFSIDIERLSEVMHC